MNTEEKFYRQGEILERRARRTIKGPVRAALMARAVARIEAATAALRVDTMQVKMVIEARRKARRELLTGAVLRGIP